MKQKRLTKITTLTLTVLLMTSCQSLPFAQERKLTSEWHQEEEAKIDNAVKELRALGKWDDRWDKFSKLGDYGWRGDMDCRPEGGHTAIPCSSGGYTFSESALEQLKRGDQSHNPHNTLEESSQQFQGLIKSKQLHDRE